jgi:hypothetical protein
VCRPKLQIYRDTQDEYPFGKPPDSKANSDGSNLKRPKLHNTPAMFSPGDRVRCPIQLFGAAFAAQHKNEKFLYGVL